MRAALIAILVSALWFSETTGGPLQDPPKGSLEVSTVTCTSIDDATFTDDFPGYICPEGFYPV